ncbi:4,5-DOPA dioxygenase extradiol [Promethearchaeum syntrophicum]|uniref:4,5-DOPA dioxygenase extradiol n=1 Tax=Promethearchaeum syntrophicum TaxID=2594042 RepID=A0A5B9DBV5_9ARCH|nr:4,5-DOPA dioxygenase extradiol [Candidatus Prometheoarchaeum syntrophicum]QEE16759.1 LigB family dioxygenase [Candidatus Prometheoarchaeum syntrophicum]
MKKLTPALFISHGSPMNMEMDNPYTRDMKKLGSIIEKPKAIVVISAHWITKDSLVTADIRPKMIYDFYGFPKELYEFKYDAPGSPAIAEKIAQILPSSERSLSFNRGLDHASYSVLKYIFPKADIPVLEISIDYNKSFRFHYDLGKKLGKLREDGILFIGSGNMIHNFKYMKPKMESPPFPWAIELDETLKTAIENKDHDSLINYKKIPLHDMLFETHDHYLPMLYILGMQRDNEKAKFLHRSIQHGSGNQLCFQVG